MERNIFKRANGFLKERLRARRRNRVLAALAVLAAIGTTAALMHPAITLGGTGADRVTVKATKAWSGLTPKDGDSVTVELWSDENGSWAKVPTVPAGTMDTARGWDYQWEDLPGKTADETAITYQVRETQIVAGSSNVQVENEMEGGGYTLRFSKHAD